jgi:hypothetical protein
MSREDAERIAWIIGDVSREFADQASAKSSARRACNLFLRSDLDLETFLDVVQQARLRTKRYTANIKAEPVDVGGRSVKPKMQYFFAILQSLIELAKPAESGALI